MAARLVRDHLGDLRSANILVLGAGDMARLAASALLASGAERITCTSRTLANAQMLAVELVLT